MGRGHRSQRAFSHSRRSSANSNHKKQQRASSVSALRNPIQLDEITVTLQQLITTNDPSSQVLQKQITRQCVICMTEKSLHEYEGIFGDSCVHIERTVCNSCLYENTKYLVEDWMIYYGDLTCPEENCHGILDYQGIQEILVFIGKNPDLFQRYDQHLMNLHLSKMPDFIWCAYDCGSGQLYDLAASGNPAVTCLKCTRLTCSKHRVIWHTDMTCDQYDLLQNQSSEGDANNKWFELFAKQCPECHWHIQKNEGCDHMTCRYCNHQFCWLCLVDYKLIASKGASQHKTTCGHYQPDPNPPAQS